MSLTTSKRYLFESPSKPSCQPGDINIYASKDSRFICRSDRCSPTTQPIAYQTKEMIEKVTVFFRETFGQCGIDGKGKIPPIFINWDQENAQWECGVIVDRRIPCRNCCALRFHNQLLIPEVVAHEYTHGVRHSISQLNSSTPIHCQNNEAGALDESIADVFAITFKHNTLGIKDWIVRGVNRDLSQPAHMDDFLGEDECSDDTDYGNIHQNSLIPSHAFYLATVGLKGDITRIARIWFKALKRINNPDETFKSFAKKTQLIAREKLQKINAKLQSTEKTRIAEQKKLDNLKLKLTQNKRDSYLVQQKYALIIENMLIIQQTHLIQSLYPAYNRLKKEIQTLEYSALSIKARVNIINEKIKKIYSDLIKNEEKLTTAKKTVLALNQAWHKVGVLA